MVDRVQKMMMESFGRYRAMYIAALKRSEGGEMLRVEAQLNAFMRGLCYGLHRNYIKRAWKKANMSELFKWPLDEIPYKGGDEGAASERSSGADHDRRGRADDGSHADVSAVGDKEGSV